MGRRIGEIMTKKFLEIEVKYDAIDIPVKSFIKRVKEEFGYKFKHLKGTDVYYKNGSKSVRYRKTKEMQELTFKRRHSKLSTRVRTEVNVSLSKEDQAANAGGFLKELGYSRHVKLYKEYYISTFPISSKLSGVGEIVWYQVKSRGKPTRTFIEIEVRGTADNKKTLDNLETRLRKCIPELNERNPLNKSLYEIYK